MYSPILTKFCRDKMEKITLKNAKSTLLSWITWLWLGPLLSFNVKRPSGECLACVSVFVKHSTVTDNLYICYLFDKSPEGHTSGNFREALNKLQLYSMPGRIFNHYINVRFNLIIHTNGYLMMHSSVESMWCEILQCVTTVFKNKN